MELGIAFVMRVKQQKKALESDLDQVYHLPSVRIRCNTREEKSTCSTAMTSSVYKENTKGWCLYGMFHCTEWLY